MANNYADGTGTLALTSVTPVITALFSTFDLELSTINPNQVHIYRMSESTSPRWADVVTKLKELAASLSLTISDENEDDYDALFYALAEHFTPADELLPDFVTMIEQLIIDENEEPDLEVLYVMAKAFDDGHGLTAISFEGAYHCDRPRPGEFGGWGSYIGKNITIHSNTGTAASVGASIDQSITDADYQSAAKLLANDVYGIINSMTDETARNAIRQELKKQFSDNAEMA